MPQLQFFLGLKDPMPLLEYQRKTVEAREYQNAYADYWNSTGTDDGRDPYVLYPLCSSLRTYINDCRTSGGRHHHARGPARRRAAREIRPPR